MKQFESTERFTNLKDLLTHLANGGVVTNMDDSCPGCGVFLDDDGVLKYIETVEEYPTADFKLSNERAGDFRILPERLIVKELRRKTRELVQLKKQMKDKGNL